MSEANIALFITSLGILIVFGGLFIWGLFSGQFKNIEDAKYRMIDIEEPPNEDSGKEGDQNA